jgi:hypothetical protein
LWFIQPRFHCASTASVISKPVGSFLNVEERLPQAVGHPIAKFERMAFNFQRFNVAGAQEVMGEFIPEYLLREQAAVGALVLFGVLRIVVAAVAFEKGWRISVVQTCCIAIAVFYSLPQLFDLFVNLYGMRAAAAAAELEGKAAGSAIALFFAPILSHRLGYE